MGSQRPAFTRQRGRPFAFDDEPTTSLRSSDHDGTVLFLSTDDDADGVPDNLDRCADTQIPEGVPTAELRPNHYALVDGDGIFDAAPPPGRSTPPTFTLDDTAGSRASRSWTAAASAPSGSGISVVQRKR